MIISPPFLPDSTGLSEDAWLDAAMAPPISIHADTLSPEGSFPLSRALAWHNGLHIQAPQPGGVRLPVRAIADGVVAFVHTPTPPNKDTAHGLNYNGFNSDPSSTTWSSDGLVIIRHKTEIGADGTTPTEITYFSAYMHLGSIGQCLKTKTPWKAGDAIYRKDEIGAPGQIYGHSGQIHFEICCDDANLRQLLKRAPDWTHQLTPSVPTANGRTDSVFGSTYIYLPAGTPTCASEPAHHLRANAAQSLSEPQWVQITYDKGASILTSYNPLGIPIGTPHTTPDEEYKIYATATKRHNKLDNTSRALSSPSGWFELLRFGRKLGPDPLPDNAAHWREIPTATGTVWADLNAAGTFKFSDADFPTFLGWNCFNDDTSPNDQRCDSPNMKMLIRDPDTANSKRMEQEQLARRLGLPEVRARLRRTICQFPCEWVRETVVERYSWLRAEVYKLAPDAPATPAWERFVRHTQALTFPRADLPADFLNANWRFHPREFIGAMRKTGWISKNELARIYPDHLYNRRETPDPSATREKFRLHINRAMRKYFILNGTRQTHFLGQGAVESSLLARMMEASVNPAMNPTHASVQSEFSGYYTNKSDLYFDKYEFRMGNVEIYDGIKFRGRGMKQLTGLENYSKYWVYRGWISSSSFQKPWWIQGNERTSKYKDLSKTKPDITNPQKLSTDEWSCIDGGAWYWEAGAVQMQYKSINQKIKNNKPDDESIEVITKSINGQLNNIKERIIYTNHAAKILMDFL